jgi:hypothetical protein
VRFVVPRAAHPGRPRSESYASGARDDPRVLPVPDRDDAAVTAGRGSAGGHVAAHQCPGQGTEDVDLGQGIGHRRQGGW